MKRILAVTIVLLLIGLSTMSFNVTAAKRAVYVDDDATPPYDGSRDHPYRYIQDGIDNATAGDTIYLANGTYYENCLIHSDLTALAITRWDPLDHLTDPDHYPPTLNGSGSGTGITIEASKVAISYLTITDYGLNDLDAAIYIKSDAADVRIENNNISDAHTGIWVKRDNPGTTRHKIISNFIHDITVRGISIIMSDSNEITNNIIEYCHWGFYIVDTMTNIIQDNEISNCFEGGVVDVGMQNAIIRNTFSDNKWGLVTVNTKGSEIRDNNFLDPYNGASGGPVWFQTFFFTNSDKWSHNYWGRVVFWPLKPIIGEFIMPMYTPIPTIRFEKLPAESQN